MQDYDEKKFMRNLGAGSCIDARFTAECVALHFIGVISGEITIISFSSVHAL
jgi:hypothetical protein